MPEKVFFLREVSLIKPTVGTVCFRIELPPAAYIKGSVCPVICRTVDRDEQRLLAADYIN